MSVCKPAEKNGVYVLHGNRGSFHSEKQPAFKAIYTVVEQVGCVLLLKLHFWSSKEFFIHFQYEFGSDLKENLLDRLNEQLQFTQNTNCGKMMDVFTAALKRHISN